jgi:hypothetical protein
MAEGNFSKFDRIDERIDFNGRGSGRLGSSIEKSLSSDCSDPDWRCGINSEA